MGQLTRGRTGIATAIVATAVAAGALTGGSASAATRTSSDQASMRILESHDWASIGIVGSRATSHAWGSSTAQGARTSVQAAALSATSTRTLRPGMRGADVTAAQRRLASLGYWLGSADGSYGDLTRQAVMALQKAAGLSRDGVLGPRTRTALNAGVRPHARTTKGRAVEIDLKHQLVLLVYNGRISTILNTSTGSGAWYTTSGGGRAHAVTPRGTFKVFRQINAWHRSPLGLLYRPKYFNGGIAVHGSTSVPAVPASHGCVRVSVPAMDLIWRNGTMPIGGKVVVY